MDLARELFNVEKKRIAGQVQVACGLAVDLEEPGEAFGEILEMLEHMIEQVATAQENHSEVVFTSEGALD